MGGPTLRCSPIDGDEVLPAVFDEDTNIGNVTCLPVVGNTIGMYVRMYVCTYVRMYVSMYVRMYVCMYVCTYVCMCVCTYVVPDCYDSQLCDGSVTPVHLLSVLG